MQFWIMKLFQRFVAFCKTITSTAFRSSLLVLALSSLSPRAAILLTCSGIPGGDHVSRGFYIVSYPGRTLETVRLVHSATAAGSYGLKLVAHEGTYDGAVLGAATAAFSLAGAYPQDLPVVFDFGSIGITPGTRVCFTMTISASPAGSSLYYSIAPFTGGCPEVVQTEGTTPPIDTFRRNGVNIVVTGMANLIVGPGGLIQPAIDAASVGDTVRVEAGNYNEDIQLRSGVNVVGAGYNETILKGTGTRSVVTATGVTDARLEGFKIYGSGTGLGMAGISIDGGTVQIANNLITGNIRGVSVSGGSSAIVRNNIVRENGNGTDAFLDYGIICLSSTPLIANNLVINNAGAGIYFAWAASSGAQVINNTVAGNNDQGVWCNEQADVVIKNNILTGNSTGISASGNSHPAISFNDLFLNRFRNYDAQSGGTAVAGLGDISADPLFDASSGLGYALSLGSPCINAGDPAVIYNDRDGSRNDMGAYGGPSGLLIGVGTPLSSGFVFTSIGTIPTSEITTTGVSIGLANVRAAVSSALSIYPYKDAPFGGRIWLQGLFGTSDSSVRYYKILAAPWTGATPPVDADFAPLTDPLSKIRYTIGPGGIVTATLENVGPDATGQYMVTDTGYWAHSDLKLIWNTTAVANGRYDLICKAYNAAHAEVPLAPNTLSRITVQVDNSPVTTEIIAVRDRLGVPFPECGIINVATDNEEIQFVITASHPNGYLRDYSLVSLYGRNRSGGVITSDQYVGSHDSSPPLWNGVTGLVATSVPGHASGALARWTTCAYQFHLVAWARTTDGFGHIYGSSFNDHYFISVGPLVTGSGADLDGDGDVDGADLALFAAEYGRLNP
jgi:hypothetical protein